MAEPEDVIAEAALHATRLVRDVRSRRRPEGPPGLADLRRRLELFVAAVFPDAPEIGIAEPPAPPSFLMRLARRRTSHLHGTLALSSGDGERIRLPGTLDFLAPADIPERYRLLALEQAARVARGTMKSLPDGELLVRDLYLLAESAAVDVMLVRMFPRLVAALREARREAGESRPDIRRPSRQELEVESLVRGLLAAPPDLPPAPFVLPGTPEASHRWAERQRQMLMRLAGPYRGMVPVPLWGSVPPTTESLPAGAGSETDEIAPRTGRSRALPRRPRTRDAADGEDDDAPGTWMTRAADLQE